MHKNPPSIFNDVIGPVMRGPSSSHTAASVRIGGMLRQILNNEASKVLFEFDTEGALATTYETQGSTIGLAAGLMGWEITHPNLPNALIAAKNEGILIDFKIVPYASSHPNTYKITAEDKKGIQKELTAISTGGGMLKITTLDGFDMSLEGDYFESLFQFREIDRKEEVALNKSIEKLYPDAIIIFIHSENDVLLNIKSRESIFTDVQKIIKKSFDITWSSEIEPVLPILSQRSYNLPFSSYPEMISYAENKDISFAELALEYESSRAGVSKDVVFAQMQQLVLITKNAIIEGLNGTEYEDRMLGQQSHLIINAEKDQKVIPSSVNKIIAYTSAIMEVKSSMGVIIATPTAGSCGVLGGALFGSFGLESDLDELTLAFLAAGLIGVFIAKDYTFAAEEGGCQVECGAASGMAAAGLVQIMSGNYMEATCAASMAMQNLIGLVCDPVANRVEVPCLGKNILAATNALNSANMSMAGYAEVIPLDEVIEAMRIVGSEMPSSLCCTGHSGLSITPCSMNIYKELNNKK